ncbi:MAG: FAD:protein FMN transferase, partial [Eggerthellaceae bacterium]|nr:FAD:protein FMN transferase [Eggerthellaceae bacterium]
MNQYRTYGISRRRFLALAGLTALAGAGVLAGCEAKTPASASAAAELQERTLFVFDTVVTLSCYCTPALMDEAIARCNRFEELFSRTREGSDVWSVNHAAGAPVAVDSLTADIVEKALGYCERSGGLFDITVGAVSQLWDFKEGVKPADDAIAEAVRHIDYRGVHVADAAGGGATVRLDDPAAAIDLGGIAKGYIADDLAALFREGGCESGIINLGGNAYVIGSKPDGSPWNVGVQDPNGADQEVIAKISGTDLSVVTSGLYEREFTKDGVRYYHILDPATGYPVKTDLVSSSVASASSLDGDAYATWMFLLGRDAALDLLESTSGLEGLVVDTAGEATMT